MNKPNQTNGIYIYQPLKVNSLSLQISILIIVVYVISLEKKKRSICYGV